jgi:hypothetical protein
LYQLKYLSPSQSADDYELTVTTNNENAADVLFMNKDLSFRKATFGHIEAPPSSHNPSGQMLATSDIGRIQIKGKQSGQVILSFTLKHKASGAIATITKNVTSIADPVHFVIAPAPTLDYMNKERDAVPFGEQFHLYQNPRFLIRLNSSILYPANTEGTASVVFSTIPSSTNVARLIIRGGTNGNPGYHSNTVLNNGAEIQLAYNTDYFVTVATPYTLPWSNTLIGSEQFVNIKMTNAKNLQTPIVAEFNDRVKYTLKSYRSPTIRISAQIYEHNKITSPSIIEHLAGAPVYVTEAGVVIKPGGTLPRVKEKTGNNTFLVRNPIVDVSTTSWGDAHELSSGALTIAPSANYSAKQIQGNTIEAWGTPAHPNWCCSAIVTIVDYNIIYVPIRDNWGYSVNASAIFSKQIVFGTNGNSYFQ